MKIELETTTGIAIKSDVQIVFIWFKEWQKHLDNATSIWQITTKLLYSIKDVCLLFFVLIRRLSHYTVSLISVVYIRYKPAKSIPHASVTRVSLRAGPRVASTLACVSRVQTLSSWST